ncbi:hypothetical protein FRC07_010216 [Ceratobasidium sp. 392]|nr:hypothetical protein FRC07_010216 [Ceratobasidium sp. 392]
MMMDLDKVDVNDQRVQDLLALGTDATAEQIARLLDKHHGHMDNAAAALLDGNFQVDEPDTRGRQTTKAIAPALPPRRKQNSPVDNSRALVRIDTSNKNNLPAYDEDLELNKALALSLAEGGGGGGGDGGVGGDDDLPPLEPVPSGPVYGPHLDPRTNRGLDESTDHALRQALEASLNDGKNSLAADVYEELDIEQQVKVSDGRPTALRSSDPNSIFAPPILQALLSIPHLLKRLKEVRTWPEGGDVESMLEAPWHEIAKQTEDLKAESAGLWTRPELTTMPYDLRAVIIHDGLLGRAHLFSYVRRADKWWKVVDSTVSEVSEETVLSDSAGVHLGAGVVCLLYASAVGEGGKDKDDIKWPRKDRLKSQKLDEPFMAQLSPEVQARLAHQPVSESPSDEEEEFMDAEEMIVVAHDHTPAEDVATGDVPDDVSMDEVVPPPAGVV